MPRTIDFDASVTEWGEVRIAPPRFGRLEMDDETVFAGFAVLGGMEPYWPQFSNYGMPRPEGATYGEALDGAHAWLDAHATGPWRWSEAWRNHGHSAAVHVYVERDGDRRAFAVAQGDLLRYRPPTVLDVERAAVANGVIPPASRSGCRHLPDDYARYLAGHQDGYAAPSRPKAEVSGGA